VVLYKQDQHLHSARRIIMASFGHLSKDDPAARFDLLERLGRGSYGEVFRGRIKGPGEIVAVKVIPLEESSLEGIQREIGILRDCDHPNVVRYYGSYFKNDTLWVCWPRCVVHRSVVPGGFLSRGPSRLPRLTDFHG
jgi:hypothetical protein